MVGIVRFWRENAWVLGIFARVILPGVLSGVFAGITLEYSDSPLLAGVVLAISLFFLTPPFVNDAVEIVNKRAHKAWEPPDEEIKPVGSNSTAGREENREESQKSLEEKELDELLDKFYRYGPEALTCNELMRLKYLLMRYQPMDERTLSLAVYAVGMLVGYRCFKS